jgi:hypothetical protein
MLPELRARWRAHWQRGGTAAYADMELRSHAGNAAAARFGAGWGNRRVRALLHYHSASGISGREFDAARPNRAPVDAFGGAANVSFETTFEVTSPAKAAKSVISHALLQRFYSAFTSSRLNTARSLMLCLQEGKLTSSRTGGRCARRQPLPHGRGSDWDGRGAAARQSGSRQR